MAPPKPLLQGGLTTFLTDEKKRGIIMSVVSGGFVTLLNYMGVVVMGLSAPTSTAIFMYGVGSITGYSLDIVFAKSEFTKTSVISGVTSHDIHKIPYGDLARRFRWLLRSFSNAPFLKFLIVSLIETLTAIALIRAVIAEFDRRVIMPDHVRWRNFMIAVTVACVVFLLFGNILRFDWAYSNVENPLMNISVLMWMALSVLVFSLAYTVVHEVKFASSSRGRAAQGEEPSGASGASGASGVAGSAGSASAADADADDNKMFVGPSPAI